MLCLRIHRGLSIRGNDDAWVRAKAVQAAAFFATELITHFTAEEQVLFPVMQDFADANELISELIAEHSELRRIATRLRRTKVGGLKVALAQFADLLESHIRKEERRLFPIYEKQVSTDVDAEVERSICDVIGDAIQPRNRRLLE